MTPSHCMDLPSTLFGPEGWRWLGIAVGGGSLSCLTKKVIRRYQ